MRLGVQSGQQVIERSIKKRQQDCHHDRGADLLPNGHRAGLAERPFHRLASACGAYSVQPSIREELISIKMNKDSSQSQRRSVLTSQMATARRKKEMEVLVGLSMRFWFPMPGLRSKLPATTLA